MHEENNCKVNKTLTGVLEMRMTIQNVYEVFCKKHRLPQDSCTDDFDSLETGGGDRKYNKDLVPFLKHLLKQSKYLEETLTSAHLYDGEDANLARKQEKANFTKFRKDCKNLIKQHYARLLIEKENTINSLSSTVARQGADLA